MSQKYKTTGIKEYPPVFSVVKSPFPFSLCLSLSLFPPLTLAHCLMPTFFPSVAKFYLLLYSKLLKKLHFGTYTIISNIKYKHCYLTYIIVNKEHIDDKIFSKILKYEKNDKI